MGHVFKEKPDSAGADAVWMQGGTLYRCQLKLGVAKRSFADLKTALDKLKEQSVRLSKQLQMPVKSILALTTEQVGDGPDGTTLVAYAEQEEVDLWDHSYLASTVWVDGLKDWARAGSHGAYFE